MTASSHKISAFLVDDEPLALKRLESLLLETGRISIAGSETDPAKALAALRESFPDVLFLDIKMPGLTGFELLEQLDSHPPVIFTTAYAEHSLDAFEYFSVDYLLKPVEKKRLLAALDKLERIAAPEEQQIDDLIRRLKKEESDRAPIQRISSRVGSKVQIIDIGEVTHFFSEDKVTFAVTASGATNPVDLSLNRLEADLDKSRFLRVHRATIVNLDFVREMHGWFAGGVMVRLKDNANTELTVARSRVKKLKTALGM